LNVRYILCCAKECAIPPGITERFKFKQVIINDVVIANYQAQWNLFDEAFKWIDLTIPKNESEIVEKQLKQIEDTTAITQPARADSNTDSEQIAEEEKPRILTQYANLAPETVYIHCMRGRSRSCAIAIAYLMNRQQMSLKDAYMFVKLRRPFIGPHDWMKRQLCKYEQTLLKQGIYKDIEPRSIVGSARDLETMNFSQFKQLEKSHNWEMLAIKNNLVPGKGDGTHEADIILDEEAELEERARKELEKNSKTLKSIVEFAKRMLS
jgi:hypothetical protein